MASLFDAFSDSLGENNSTIKIIIYSLPVFFCSYLYIIKNIYASYFLAIPTALLILSLMSNGINNVRSNKREILTFNLFALIAVAIKLLLAVLPLFAVMFFVGVIITNNVKIPFDIPYIQLVFNLVIWLIIFSVVFTSYLAFSKSLNVVDSYNLKVVFESSVDVLINFLFLVPQLVIVNGIIVGLAWYVIFLINFPLTSPLFVFYCSCVFVFNISALSSYFASASYELIKGRDSEYRDNYNLRGTGAFSQQNKR